MQELLVRGVETALRGWRISTSRVDHGKLDFTSIGTGGLSGCYIGRECCSEP